MTFDYDLLVIGAGSAGLASSKKAAGYGANVAILEGDLVGGTCVIRGCIPKKLMVYASTFSHLYHEAVGYGWSSVESSFNWGKLVENVRNEVMRLNQLHIDLLAKAGVTLIKGLGQFVDAHTVAVGDRTVTAEKILIAVGGAPVKPKNISGIEHSITSREMFHLSEFPKRFAVLGGGYIGVEFAGIMNGLGAEVTQIIRRDLILRGFDRDMRSHIQAGMIQHGVTLLQNTEIQAIEKTPAGLKISFVDDVPDPIAVDAILCATGRKPKPNLDPLCLEKAGVKIDGDYIPVSKDSRTNIPHIFAVGDCTDRMNLTPVAIAEGRAFADTEFGNLPRFISYENIPSAIFSQPEGATVGFAEADAIGQFGEENIQSYCTKFRPLFHSLTDIDEKILVKLVVEKNTDRVLGAHMVGKNAAEIIQGMAISVNRGATKKEFDATIGIHPSTAEEFVTLR